MRLFVLVCITLFLLTLVSTGEAFDRAGNTKAAPKKKRRQRKTASGASTSTTKSNKKQKPSKAKAEKDNEFSKDEPAVVPAAKAVGSDQAAKSKTFVYDLEHSTSADGDSFTSRGTIEVTISKRSKSVRVDSSNIRSSLTKEEITRVRALAKDQQFYRLRLPSLPGSDRKVIASIPACTLMAGNFKESLWLHLDLSGHLVAFDYVTPIATGECNDAVLAKALQRHQGEVQTSTTVQIAKAKNGHRVPNKIQGISPPPPGMEHLIKQTPAQEQAANQPGFLRRYWYIILPVALMMLLPGGK
jgi:hypothetical protein